MSTINNFEHNELITCDLCQRNYNINVYKRHRNENQCIKRNQHRLPFESIKQRSIQIGDKIFSVQEQQQQQQLQKTNDVQTSNNREKKKQEISNHNNNTNKQYQEKFQRMLPNNNHRRILEQAKQLLERRTKYQPPWIQKRSNITKEYQSKLNRTNTIILQTKVSSHHIINQRMSPKKCHSRERPSPPTTKFKNDDLPIKISDRRNYNHIVSEQPIITNSPKIRISQVTTISKHQQNPSNRIDQTYFHEQPNSACQSTRKAYTWTRSSKQTTNRDVISPIHIPTFYESSSLNSQFHERLPISNNQNYDDDEFERYSPSPISTPKYQQEKTEIKNLLPTIYLNEQKTFIRPNTYQKSKRSNQTKSTIHLPPINPTTNSKLKHRSIKYPTPWR